VVNGTPPNPPFLARIGVTSTFDPFVPPARSAGTSAADVATVEQDHTTNAAVGRGRARIAGYVTNKEDETIDAELEVWDAGGAHDAGRSADGAFDVPVQAGDVTIVARADGYLSEGVTLHVGKGGRGRAGIVLNKLPKVRKAVLEQDRIAVQTRVPFEFKKPRLQSTAEYVLADVVDVLLRNPALRVRVEVHAEPLGTPDESQALADERAAAVIDTLVQHGVWRARLDAKGVPLEPVAADQGRRVDFILVP
jgi:outer membrane protein OmpA-like peptidoglycan-associated protein